ncbi:hypothetical protein KV697_14195 [Sphingomonas sanguinis]|uniref:hypothetical protein n=1 Tax=Sphingomonas sanguinis TaxID=33051 RepID=UPI001C59ABCD|nr:hypothetical protein [Sphingomonas sanguinis]QXT34921.1 hypothetical protein KV697_14195 [Sphingomonas sanguinis]
MLPETPTLSQVHAVVLELMPRPEGATSQEAAAWQDDVRREMALYSALAPELRSAVDKRLREISRLPPATERRTQHVVDAAKELGLGQSAMYGLLKRVSDSGPISGLVPGRRTRIKPSAARDGFGSPIDEWIATVMSEQPDISIADVSRWITTGIKDLSARGMEAPKAPAMSALRERVHVLRNQRPKMVDPLRAGGELVIDQCPLNLSIRFDHQRRGATGLFIVDRSTTIVLGVGIFVEKRADVGLTMAVRDLHGRLRSLRNKGLILPTQPTTVFWVVPPILTSHLVEVRKAAASIGPISLVCSLGRSGAELTKLIGERLGPYRLIPRAVLDDYPMESGERMRFVDLDAEDVQIALDGLLFEVDKRNDRLLGDQTMRSDSEAEDDPRVTDYAEVIERLFGRISYQTPISYPSGSRLGRIGRPTG